MIAWEIASDARQLGDGHGPVSWAATNAQFKTIIQGYAALHATQTRIAQFKGSEVPRSHNRQLNISTLLKKHVALGTTGNVSISNPIV